MLEKAFQKGYKCYAILGYDPFIKDYICAWIKFIEIPKEYINTISALKVE